MPERYPGRRNPRVPEASRQPWDRQDGETPRHYAYFLIYRNAPGSPTVTDVAAGASLSARYLRAISVTNRWKERKTAWIVYCEEIEETRAREHLQDRLQAHEGAAQRLINKGLAVMDAIEVKDVTDKDRQGKVTGKRRVVANVGAFGPAVQAIERGIIMERLKFGMPTQISRIEHELRVQIEASIEVQSRLLSLLGVLICDDCRDRIADELDAIQSRLDQTVQATARYSDVGSTVLLHSGD